MESAAVFGKARGLDRVALAALGVPAVVTREHRLARKALHICLIDRMGPVRPSGHAASRPVQRARGIEAALVSRRLVPIPPALSLYVGPNPAVHKHRLRELAPRAPQINGAVGNARGRRKAAAVEHEPLRLALGSGRRGHVSVDAHVAVERANLTALEVRTAAAEDKVDVTLDEAAAKVLAPHDARRELFRPNEAARLDLARGQWPAKERVLMPEQTTAVNHEPVAVGVERQPLAHLTPVARIVHDSQVPQRHVRRVHEHRIRAKRPELAVDARAVVRLHEGTQAAHDAHALGRLAGQGHVGAANLDALTVVAGRDAHLDGQRGIRNLLAGRRKGRRNRRERPLNAHSHPKNPLFHAHPSPLQIKL